MVKRIYGLDFYRGLAILFMLFFHGFQMYEGSYDNYVSGMESNPIVPVFRFLARWAGLFVFISGYGNAISMYERLATGKKKPKNLFNEALVTGIWLILLEHLTALFIERKHQGGGIYDLDEGPWHYSVLGGLIETKKFQLPTIYSTVINMGALAMLGSCLIIIGIILPLLFRNGGYKHNFRNLVILGALGVLVTVISPFTVEKLRPLWINTISEERYGAAVALSFIVGDTHALCPMLAYCIFGTMFGIASVNNYSRGKVVWLSIPTAIIFIVIGIIQFSIYGEPPMGQILRTVPSQSMYLQLGLMFILVTVLYWVQMGTPTTPLYRMYASVFVRRFGNNSLTIYITEGIFSTFLKCIILDTLFPGWAKNMVFIVIYSFALIIIWTNLLKLWERVDYKGSFEWMTAGLKSFFAGHKERVSVRALLKETQPTNSESTDPSIEDQSDPSTISSSNPS